MNKKYTETQWQMRHMLNDVVEWFGEDPKGRRSLDATGMCLYAAPENKPGSIGCGIGMYLEREDASFLDLAGGNTIGGVLGNKEYHRRLPDWMIVMSPFFLKRMQLLHDGNHNWNMSKPGLTTIGKQEVDAIIKTFNLPKTIYG